VSEVVLREGTFRVRPVLRRRTTIENAAARAQLRILQAARRDILAALVNASAFEKWRLTLLLQVVDREISQGRASAERAVETAMRQAFGLGSESVASAVGLEVPLIGTSRELVRSIVEVTQDQVRDVWGELGSRLKGIIRRAAIGVTDPFSAMRALAKIIRDPKTFGRAFWRAETIVRTEVIRTYSIASQHELERATQAGVKVRKYWLSARDERVRAAHREAGERYGKDAAIPWDAAFEVGGEKLRYPLDPNGSAENTINCFLPDTRIGGRVLLASKAWYAGTAWRIETARGHRLSTTPNHPVLTGRGWVRAHEVRVGDHLLADPRQVDDRAAFIARHVHDENSEPRVDEVFEALAANGRLRLAVVPGLDFHGDAARFTDAYVDVVAVDRSVLHCIEARALQRLKNLALEEYAAVVGATLPRQRTALHLGGVGPAVTAGGVRGGDLPAPCGWPHPLPLQPLLLGLAAKFDAALAEDSSDANAADAAGRGSEAEAFRDAQDRLAGLVTPDDVVRVVVERYAGPTFDVQTVAGWVHSNGIVAHNCRCVQVPVVLED
jgi:hypothetical protein